MRFLFLVLVLFIKGDHAIRGGCYREEEPIHGVEKDRPAALLDLYKKTSCLVFAHPKKSAFAVGSIILALGYKVYALLRAYGVPDSDPIYYSQIEGQVLFIREEGKSAQSKLVPHTVSKLNTSEKFGLICSRDITIAVVKQAIRSYLSKDRIIDTDDIILTMQGVKLADDFPLSYYTTDKKLGDEIVFEIQDHHTTRLIQPVEDPIEEKKLFFELGGGVVRIKWATESWEIVDYSEHERYRVTSQYGESFTLICPKNITLDDVKKAIQIYCYIPPENQYVTIKRKKGGESILNYTGEEDLGRQNTLEHYDNILELDREIYVYIIKSPKENERRKKIVGQVVQILKEKRLNDFKMNNGSNGQTYFISQNYVVKMSYKANQVQQHFNLLRTGVGKSMVEAIDIIPIPQTNYMGIIMPRLKPLDCGGSKESFIDNCRDGFRQLYKWQTSAPPKPFQDRIRFRHMDIKGPNLMQDAQGHLMMIDPNSHWGRGTSGDTRDLAQTLAIERLESYTDQDLLRVDKKKSRFLKSQMQTFDKPIKKEDEEAYTNFKLKFLDCFFLSGIFEINAFTTRLHEHKGHLFMARYGLDYASWDHVLFPMVFDEVLSQLNRYLERDYQELQKEHQELSKQFHSSPQIIRQKFKEQMYKQMETIEEIKPLVTLIKHPPLWKQPKVEIQLLRELINKFDKLKIRFDIEKNKRKEEPRKITDFSFLKTTKTIRVNRSRGPISKTSKAKKNSISQDLWFKKVTISLKIIALKLGNNI